MAVDRDTPTLSDYYTTTTESEIRKQVWLTQTDATYELVYQVKKTGIHALTQAAPELYYSNREWQMSIKGTYYTVPAFQSCMFEKGTHIVSRHHALPGSTQKPPEDSRRS